ncbi:MAG: glycine zipper domain-containing protein [Gemmatimonadota bacterium]
MALASLGAALCGLAESHSCPAKGAGYGFVVGAPLGAFIGALIGSNFHKRE